MDLLFLKLLEDSPIILENGEEIVDLTSPILNERDKFNKNYSFRSYIVGDDFTAKPTLISSFIYGDEGKIDLLCYYNGYSNPFAIAKGDTILVPSIDESVAIMNSSTKNNINLAKEALNKKIAKLDTRGFGSIETPNMANGEQITQNGNTVILSNKSSNNPILKTIFKNLDQSNDSERFEDALVDYAKGKISFS